MSDKTKIPKGHYCYSINPFYDPDINSEDEAYNYCPFSTHKTINGVVVPWCSFLDQGGTSNGMEDRDFDKLIEHFGCEENIDKGLPLVLLWDSVKECGENVE